MARVLRTAEEIWLEIESTLRLGLDGYADPTVYLPLPSLLSLPDATGCNWCLAASSTDSGNQARIEAAVQMARTRFNLTAKPAHPRTPTALHAAGGPAEAVYW